MTEESAVKVCVRVRPLIKREEADNAEPVQLYWKSDKQAIHQTDYDGNTTKSFSFDRVFNEVESTHQLYQDIAKPLVVSAVEGYNGTIFAYGQTSSGKTFTMLGSEHKPGVIPLAMADVFDTIKSCPKKEFLLRVSYMEIYNETVTDLLCDSWKRKPLEIREGNNKNVYVADLTEELVTTSEQAVAWLRKGEKNRHYCKTKMNEMSSRSHAIFRMILERSDPTSENADGAIIVSHLNLVDLAGSERASQTGAEGTRFKEGCNINLSLFTLGQVIKKLSDESQRGFTNYRDSKLTRILQNSLGGNAKTVIICTITPAAVDETLSTLQFASAAKRMKNDPHVVEVLDEGALLRRYRNEIADLKQRLHEVSSVTHTTVTERETLFQLLQEKNQLQCDQADRIKNLTRLLVTASNVVPVQKVPRRRVTWGGKPLSSPPLVPECSSSDMSFAEPFFKKRKAHLSVTEEGDEKEEFETPSFYSQAEDMSVNQSNVTFRNSAEGLCRDLPHLMFQVECLEQQLQTETQEKEMAEEKSVKLEQKTEKLEKQLQSLVQQLETEVREKQRVERKCSTLELKLEEVGSTELEKDNKACEQSSAVAEQDIVRLQHDNEVLVKEKETLLRDIKELEEAKEFQKLEEQSKNDYERELEAEISALKTASTDADNLVQTLKSKLEVMSGEMKKKNDLVADLQSLNGKDLVQEVAQLRRSLDDAEGLNLETKKDWAFLRSENLSLKERDATLTTQYDQMENEVKSLQSQIEHEKSRFKKMQADLQKELLGVFDENTKLTALLDGKVPKHLLDNVTLEKTVADLKKELEKSQKRENTLQTTMEELKALEVLPAKVDDLLTQVCELTGQLYAVQEERDRLVSAQAVSSEDNERLKGEAFLAQEELDKMKMDLTNAELEEVQLRQQHTEITEQLTRVQTDMEHLAEENRRLLSTMEEMKQQSVQLSEKLESLQCEMEQHLSDLTATTEERNRLQAALHSKDSEQAETVQNLQTELQTLKEEREQVKRDLEENVELMIESQEDLRSALETVKVQKDKILNLEAEKAQLESRLSNSAEKSLVDLQVQVEELQSVSAGRECIVSEKAVDSDSERKQTEISSLSEERDQLRDILREEKSQLKREMEGKDKMQLQEQLTALTEENHQMKMDARENVEMMIETQAELRTALATIKELEQNICMLNVEKTQLETKLSQRDSTVESKLVEDLNIQIKTLHEELKAVYEEKQCLENTRDHHDTEELERVRANVCALTEERDQLLEALQVLREEKSQIKNTLDEKEDMMAQLREELESATAERDELLSEAAKNDMDAALEKSHECVSALSEERDQLLETVHALQQDKNQMSSEMEKKNQKMQGLKKEAEEMTLEISRLTAELREMSKVGELTGTLSAVQEEKSSLFVAQSTLNEENTRLKEELEKAQEDLVQMETQMIDSQLKEAESSQQHTQTTEQLIKAQADMECFTVENGKLLTSLEEAKNKAAQMEKELKSLHREREKLLSAKSEGSHDQDIANLRATVASVTEERNQLQEILQGLRQEHSQLRRDLEESNIMLLHVQEKPAQSEISSQQEAVCVQDELQQQLQEQLTALTEENHQMKMDARENVEMMIETQAELRTALATIKELEQNICMLNVEKTQLETKLSQRDSTVESKLVEDLNIQIKTLHEELKAVYEEKQCLENTRDHHDTEELERVRANVCALTEERDQLLEALQVLREEKSQIKNTLDEKEDMMAQLREELESATAERDELLSEAAKNDMDAALEKSHECVSALSEERDQLLETVHALQQDKNQMSSEMEKKNQKMQGLKKEAEEMTLEISRLTAELREMSKVGELTGTLSAVQEEKSSLFVAQSTLNEENTRLKEELEKAQEDLVQMETQMIDSQLKEAESSQQHTQTTEQLIKAQADMECFTVENGKLLTSLEEAKNKAAQMEKELKSLHREREKLLSAKSEGSHDQDIANLRATVASVTEERNQLQEILQGLRQEHSQLRRDLEESNIMLLHVQEKPAQSEISSQQEAVCVQDELQQQLQEQLTALTEENHQMKMDARENVEMMIETQAELRTALATIKELEQNICMLNVEKTQLETKLSQRDSTVESKLVEDLNIQIKTLHEELKAVYEEKQCLENTRDHHDTEELERVRANVCALTEERDQLLEALQVLREEKSQIKNTLDEKEDMMAQLREELESATAERDELLSEAAKNDMDAALEKSHECVSALSEERDQLLETVHALQQDKNQMSSEMEKKNQKLMEELQSVSAEKDNLMAEKCKDDMTNKAELERHQNSIASLTEERDQMKEENNQLKTELEETTEKLRETTQERDQLLELLQGLKEEKIRLKKDIEEKDKMIQCLKDEVECLRNESAGLRKNLQETAETAKTYQTLLHSTREELNANVMTQGAEKHHVLQQQIGQLNANITYLSEQLLSKKASETQSLSMEVQSLQTHVASLEEEKAKLLELLESARNEETNLRRDLQEREETKHSLMEELRNLVGIKEQLINEKTHADQLQEVFHVVREERDQLLRELEEKTEALSHFEEKVRGLEREKMRLESEVSSLSQALHEQNEQMDVPANESRLKLISEIETCNEKLKVAFLKLQAIIDRPKPKDHLAGVNSKENSLIYQLLHFVPVSQRTVFACLISKTNQIDDLLGKNEGTLRRFAALHKAHFMKQIHFDMASFDERRLQDLLIRQAQTPSKTLQMLPADFQETWDQRLLELWEKRRQYVQNMNGILDFLEDGVAKHAVTLSEELQARNHFSEESRALTDTAAIIQVLERELARRTALKERQRAFHQIMLDKYDSTFAVLKHLEDESVQRRKEETSERLALLPSRCSEKPKTEADLLLDKQRLSNQLRQAQKHFEELQKQTEDLKAQADASNQKHVAKLEELSSTLREKGDVIQTLQMKLKESEALAKTKMPPSAAEMEAMKDKLVKMEFDHIAVTTRHEKEITQLTSVAEHRGDVIRKLKESLRKTQQPDERAYGEAHSKASSQAQASTCLKEKKIEELEKKTAQFESLVNKQQDEIAKWKNRAYKLRGSKKVAPLSPHTPPKRPLLLTDSEMNSPKKTFLDSPKSKFFDVHTNTETMSLKCPKQFFDNSNLGTISAEPAVGDFSDSDEDAVPSTDVCSSDPNTDSWWQIPNSSPNKTNLDLDANKCPMQ